MLTFHSNNQIIINVRDNLGTDLNSKINQITFKNNSKEIFKNGDVSVFQYQSKGSDINSFGCFNYGNIALNIILSFDYDDNIIVAGNVYEILVKSFLIVGLAFIFSRLLFSIITVLDCPLVVNISVNPVTFPLTLEKIGSLKLPPL